MIEILNRKKKRIGFIEGKNFYNKKHKKIGYIEGNIVKNNNGHNLLRFDRHDDIFLGSDPVGYILDSKIYFREEPLFEISEQAQKISSLKDKESIFLKGNSQKIDSLDYLGVITIFFETRWFEKICR
jgi:hypothetical protein